MTRIFENRTLEEIRVGESASLEQSLTQGDLRLWSALAGNLGFDSAVRAVPPRSSSSRRTRN